MVQSAVPAAAAGAECDQNISGSHSVSIGAADAVDPALYFMGSLPALGGTMVY